MVDGSGDGAGGGSANIRQGGALRFGAVTRDGKEVVLGMALSRVGENAANVVDAVKGKTAIVEQSLPDGVKLRPIYDRTELVDKAVWTAVKACRIFLLMRRCRKPRGPTCRL